MLFGHWTAVSVRRLCDTAAGVGWAPTPSGSSVCLCGSVLGAHQYPGKEQIPSEITAKQRCHSAAAGCAARLLGHHTCGFPPALLGRVLKRKNFDQSCLSSSVEVWKLTLLGKFNNNLALIFILWQ